MEAKIARSLQVLDWLGERYDVSLEIRLIKKETLDLHRTRTVIDIRSVEGRVAAKYWKAFNRVLPEHLVFPGRMTTSHQNNASDPVNLTLNYGYGFLEGECRPAINSVGLEPAVGFLHDCGGYQTKQSLVYDLQEPFRWLVDVSVIEAFESGTLGLKDFYFTADDYRYRFDLGAKQRFINLLRERFNARVTYKGRNLKWDTVIEQKMIELGRFLTGKSTALDFAEPSPKLLRQDDRELRRKILALSQSDAKGLGIEKSTLYYLRKNASNERGFMVREKVKERLLSA